MPQGRPQYEYFSDPKVHHQKRMAEVYADMDRFTFEVFANEDDAIKKLFLYVILPPLKFEHRFVKGLMFCQGVDYLLELVPQVKDYFILVGNSKWCATPWSRHADGLLNNYRNPKRENWFQTTHPDRAHQVLLPLQARDYTNEYVYAPQLNQQRPHDLLCISRLDPCKNLPILAEAFATYHKKYQQNMKLTLVIGKPTDRLDEREQSILTDILKKMGSSAEQFELLGHLDHHKALPQRYAQSKITLLSSLLEGKNRSLAESVLCNTPVICFEAFNQYIRGADDAFPRGGGLYAPYHPEGMADCIHQILSNYDEFTPRKSYLGRGGGRTYCFDTCLSAFEYYRDMIPDFNNGPPHQNLWLQMAIHYNYQLSLTDYMYDKAHHLSLINTPEQIQNLLSSYTAP